MIYRPKEIKNPTHEDALTHSHFSFGEPWNNKRSHLSPLLSEKGDEEEDKEEEEREQEEREEEEEEGSRVLLKLNNGGGGVRAHTQTHL